MEIEWATNFCQLMSLQYVSLRCAQKLSFCFHQFAVLRKEVCKGRDKKNETERRKREKGEKRRKRMEKHAKEWIGTDRERAGEKEGEEKRTTGGS